MFVAGTILTVIAAHWVAKFVDYLIPTLRMLAYVRRVERLRREKES